MEIEVLKEKENVFLKRKDLELEIKHDSATPSKLEVVKELASRYSVPENCILLNYIFTKKGTRVAVAKAKIYKEPVVKNEPEKEKASEKKAGDRSVEKPEEKHVVEEKSPKEGKVES